MTKQYEEYMLEHRIYSNGKFKGYGSVVARSLQQILFLKEEIGVEDNFIIRGWTGTSWDSLIDKNFFMVEMKVHSLNSVLRKKQSREMAY